MTVWTSYQGIEVIESDPKVKCRHPKFGYDPDRLAILSGASLLALVDGTFLVVCDECGFNGLTGRNPYVKPEGEYKPIIKQADSLLAHINGKHHPNKKIENKKVEAAPRERHETKPRYTDDQIKVAIKIWLKWKGTRIKNWGQAACEELAKLGFKPSVSAAWNSDQLGSLVRNYMRRDQFKHIKAAPLDQSEQEALASMVREAAERAGSRGSKTTVAVNARITTRGKAPHKHTPVDFQSIIEASEAAKADRETQTEDEDPVAKNPTLNFVGRGGDSGVESTPTRTLTIDRSVVETVVEPAPVIPTPRVEVILPPSSYEHIVDLPDGTPMFKYNGVLMVGKQVKGVEV